MIFLYHRVVEDAAPAGRLHGSQALALSAFRRQVTWLQRRFRLVSLDELLCRGRGGARLASITFDDGLAETCRLAVPELTQRRVPVTIFLPTEQFRTRDLYWFTYLDALCHESAFDAIEYGGERFPLRTAEDRRETRRRLGQIARHLNHPAMLTSELRSRYPLPRGLSEAYRSLTATEVRNLASPLVSFGSHTDTHPYLDRLSLDEQKREMMESREALRDASGQPVRHFAYPGGVYNDDSLSAAEAAGFDAAFATVPRRPAAVPRYEIGRVGIYSASMPKLIAKSFGAAQVLRAINVNAG